MVLLTSFWWYFIILVFTLFLTARRWMIRRFKHWKNKGVFGPEPILPFGNVKDMLTLKKHGGVVFMDMYKKYKDLPFFGIFLMFRPTLIINDLELIKAVLVKDFVYFPDHLIELDSTYEPLHEHLFNACGEKWKAMRTKLTPTFTTAKMKYMFETLNNCRSDLDLYVERNIAKCDKFNVKELLSHFGMNVIASCAFGVDCNAFENPDSKFIKAGKAFFGSNPFKAFLQILAFFCLPDISKNLKCSLIGKETNDFFHELVKNTIEYRNENNIKRNDFLQILMDLQKNGYEDESSKNKNESEFKLSFMQMAAQAFVFFIAGYETSATVASYALYELALHSEIQEKLRKDIGHVLEKYDGKITYDGLIEMTYLTKVIEETMRKYPPLPMLFRLCAKNYKIPNTNIIIEKDTAVMIPIYAIQNDPQYWPEPEKFDPERFSPQNKASMNRFTYMPFGEGPRICIGSRFGMMETKLGLLSILTKYKVSPCDKTLIPMEFDNINIVMAPKDGLWLRFTKI